MAPRASQGRIQHCARQGRAMECCRSQEWRSQAQQAHAAVADALAEATLNAVRTPFDHRSQRRSNDLSNAGRTNKTKRETKKKRDICAKERNRSYGAME